LAVLYKDKRPFGAVFSKEITLFIVSIIEYIKETKAELSHVNWLSRSQVLAYTILVVAVCVVVSLVLSAFDLGLLELLKMIQ
jgi:preprotein translocase SecE subunit